VRDLNPLQIWTAALGSLELQVSRPSYNTWLKGTVGLSVSYDTKELVVGTPSPFVAQWLEKRMSSLVEACLLQISGEELGVRFTVVTEPPIRSSTDEPSPPKEAQGFSARPSYRRTLPYTSNLNPKYTLDSFIVGESNQLAYAAAVAVSSTSGNSYNPLFLYGGVGLGKTHLLHAIGHASAQRGLTYLYTSSEQFTNEFITAIQTKKTSEFRDRYRSVDVLLIDDIQFIRGKDAIQEGFFHTFNALHNSNRQIVIASDRPSHELSPIEDRLRSRFAWGLTTDIKSPNLGTRSAILRAKAMHMPYPVPADVLDLISARFHFSIRDLEGALNRVQAYADLTAQAITLESARHCLADLIVSQDRHSLSPRVIVEEVCNYYDVSPQLLASRRRSADISTPRQVAVYLLRELAQCSLKEIGAILGGRDHSSIRYAWARIDTALGSDSRLLADITELRRILSLQTQ
ncbi:uncharacterized protein METZ01_LOCUS146236, partial [marine metagenome]